MLCIYLYHMHAWSPKKTKEGVRSPGTEVMDDFEPPRGFWMLNLCPLKEHRMILTVLAISPAPTIDTFLREWEIYEYI